MGLQTYKNALNRTTFNKAIFHKSNLIYVTSPKNIFLLLKMRILNINLRSWSLTCYVVIFPGFPKTEASYLTTSCAKRVDAGKHCKVNVHSKHLLDTLVPSVGPLMPPSFGLLVISNPGKYLSSNFFKVPKLTLLAYFCNFKWKKIGNSCQPNEFGYKFRFVTNWLS